MAKSKSLKQVRYLLSEGSPLSGQRQRELKEELHAGRVKVVKNKQKKK